MPRPAPSRLAHAACRNRTVRDRSRRRTFSGLLSAQIVGVSSIVSWCGSTMNFQPTLGSMNRTRVG